MGRLAGLLFCALAAALAVPCEAAAGATREMAVPAAPTAAGAPATSSGAVVSFSPDGGSFVGSASVTLTCDPDDLSIRFTTDGTEPTWKTVDTCSSGCVLSLGVGTTTLKAVAVDTLSVAGNVTSADFLVTPAVGSLSGVKVLSAPVDSENLYATIYFPSGTGVTAPPDVLLCSVVSQRDTLDTFAVTVTYVGLKSFDVYVTRYDTVQDRQWAYQVELVWLALYEDTSFFGGASGSVVASPTLSSTLETHQVRLGAQVGGTDMVDADTISVLTQVFYPRSTADLGTSFACSVGELLPATSTVGAYAAVNLMDNAEQAWSGFPVVMFESYDLRNGASPVAGVELGVALVDACLEPDESLGCVSQVTQGFETGFTSSPLLLVAVGTRAYNAGQPPFIASVTEVNRTHFTANVALGGSGTQKEFSSDVWLSYAAWNTTTSGCPDPYCNHHGDCDSATGTCLCDVGWTGDNCTLCAEYAWGPECLPCEGKLEIGLVCSGRGVCNGSATHEGTGLCDCDGNYGGLYCQDCEPNFYGANCSACHCAAHEVCNATIAGDGACSCAPYYVGDECEFHCANNCTQGRGECRLNADGDGAECVCDEPFGGQWCADCDATHWGDGCNGTCPACSSHGACDRGVNGTGVCICDDGFDGTLCTHGTDASRNQIITIAIVGAGCVLVMLGAAALYRRWRTLRARADLRHRLTDDWAILEKRRSSVFESLLSDATDWLIDSSQLQLGEEVFHGTYGGHPVAIKRLYDSTWEYERFEQSFSAEIGLLCRLHHPNVVRFFGASYVNQRFFVITEYCGRSLSHLIEEHDAAGGGGGGGGVVSAALFRSITMDIIHGMVFLHSKNVVHCDLKPENVLLQRNAIGITAKLCDFGLARLAEATKRGGSKKKRVDILGTPVYMAPELLSLGGDLGPVGPHMKKVDVYSFGVTLCSFFSGRLPYRDASVMSTALLSRIVTGDRPVVSAAAPPRLAELISDCWAIDPSDRPTFEEVRRRFEEIEVTDEHLEGGSVGSIN